MDLTIATVVKDSQDDFFQTLKSVESSRNSDSDCFEYLVVDSSGDDNIKDLCKHYEWVKYFYVQPSGIFDAMNNAARLSENGYIYYLNAGDELSVNFSNDVRQHLDKDYDVIYANLGISMYVEHPLPLAFILLGEIPFSHQSVITKVGLVDFKTTLRNVADMDMYLKLHLEGRVFHYIDCIIARVAPMKMSKYRFRQRFETYYVLLSRGLILSAFCRAILSIINKKIFRPNRFIR
jgi:hypothetical protein